MVEYSIEITERARRDIDEAFDYIAFHLENPLAAYDLTDAIYSSIGDLSSMPERFPAWKRQSPSWIISPVVRRSCKKGALW